MKKSHMIFFVRSFRTIKPKSVNRSLVNTIF